MKIGYCVGVWDCLHGGHRLFIERARRHCDYLIVGVATDWLTRVQKGHERPHDSYELRCEKMRELADRVVEHDTLDLTNDLRFVDVLIMGEHQRNIKYAGNVEVVRLPYTEGISTTQILGDK